MGRIDRLEVFNFKSYRGEQNIGPFSSRFTAIIGPNGSGKSNVMDAISFVLGVNSKDLRGSKLKDLIYRAPEDDADASSYGTAYVTLVYVLTAAEGKALRRSEGAELHFSRHISAGDDSSSYRIDGKTVTAEVYEETLKTIGVLVKARNFLVFQGDVINIATQEPVQITKLLERVSGSGDLQHRYSELESIKNVAEEQTMESFQKRKGVTAERKQFKEQQAEVDRFKQLQVDKQRLRVQKSLFSIFCLEEDTRTTDNQRQTHEEEVARLNERVGAVQKEIQEHSKSHAALLKKLHKEESLLQEDIQRGKKELSQVQVRERITHTLKQVSELKLDIQREKVEIEKQEGKTEQLRAQLQSARQMLQAYEQEMEQARLQVEHVAMNASQKQEYKRLRNEASTATASVRAELETALTSSQADRESLASMTASKSACESAIHAVNRDMEDLAGRSNQLASKLSLYQADLKECSGKIVTSASRAQQAETERKALEGKLSIVKEKLNFAKVDSSEMERLTRRRENLESLQRMFAGVKGSLSSLITPASRKYATAVSVVLGKHLDSIVVDTEKTAIECINYLRLQRRGILTFLPLSSLSVTSVDPHLRSLGGSAIPLVDVIQCDASVKRAVQFACGSTILCGDMAEGRKLAFGSDRRLKIVTLQGAVISKAGLMTGG